MNKPVVILATATLAALIACSVKEEVEPAPDTTEQESVFDPMVDTIERAKQVETEVENRVKEMNRKLEELEGNDQP